MNKVFFYLSLSLMVLGAFSCSKKASYLLVIHGGGGQINPDSATTGTLVINDAAKNVFFFSDRPNRKAGKESMQQFMEDWAKGENSFKMDHPNAALVGDLSTKEKPFTEIPVLVYAPEYNAKADQLTFKIKTFDDTHKLEQQNLGEVVLFMDGAPGPGIGIGGSYDL